MFSKKSLPVFPLLIAALLVLLLGLSCNLPFEFADRLFEREPAPTSTALPTPTPQPLPPTVVETEPNAGSTISLQQPITLYFNQEMDAASVEAALAGEPALSGSLVWISPSALVYTPDQPLHPNTELTLQLNTEAKAANGLSLQQPLEWTFVTPAALRPTNFLPAPEAEGVDPSSAVVVSFNQPVVPLGEDLAEAPAAFTLSPATPGVGEWINTSTYQFQPTAALAGRVQYFVQLNAELISTADAGLAADADQQWSFTTSVPMLLNWSPTSGESNVHLDASLTLTFNQPMDPTSLADHLRVRRASGTALSGELEWSEDLREVTFIPDTLLERSTSYGVLVPAEVKTAGGTNLGKDTTWQFETVGQFSFLGTPGGQYYTTSISDGVTLYFNSPIDLTDIKDELSFVPQLENFSPYLGGTKNVLHISGDFSPLTDYTLSIDSSLSDRWGSSLDGPLTIQFTTEPLRPQLSISQGLNDLFITPAEDSIPAVAANLYQASFNLGTIPLEDYAYVLNPANTSEIEQYYPADLRFWSEFLSVRGDDTYQIDLPLNTQGTSLPTGLYRYQVSSQELSYNQPPFILVVSDLHLTLKVSPYNLLVWAVNLETNQPAGNAPIRIYDQSRNLLFSGETDPQGIFTAEFDHPRSVSNNHFYVLSGAPGQENFGLSYSTWNSGAQPYQFSLSSDYQLPEPVVHLYTDRPIYRPGQTVNYRIIKRRPDGQGGYLLPEKDEITVTYTRAREDKQESILSLSDFGTAQGSFQLSASAQPGLYSIKTEDGVVYFQVAEYRKPEVELDIELDQGQTLLEEGLGAQLSARYYFDAPAGELPLDWTVRASETQFSLPGYQVGLIGRDYLGYYGPYYGGFWGVPIASGEGRTNSAGEWALDEPLTAETESGSQIELPAVYTLEVTAQDESGFSVSSREEMIVHPAEFYIGVNPGSRIGLADEEMDFEIKTVDWEKQSAGVPSLRAVFSRVTWEAEYDRIGMISYQRQKETVSSANISTGTNGEGAVAFTPPAPGTYQLDVYGGGARTEVIVWVSGSGAVNWPDLSNDKIKLVADRSSYLPGETAEIFIPNPFPEGALALITLEQDRLISQETQQIDAAGTTLFLPLDKGDAPNVYLSVTLLGKDGQGRADFRQGYLNLLVEPVDKVMNVDLVGNPQVIEPRGEVEFTIRVTDREGSPLQGEFSLAVVDTAVLALADPYAEDIEEAFFSVRPLSVRLGMPLTIQAGRNILVPGGIGGGGDGMDLSIRQEFEDTGYWNAEIVTNQEGIAVVTVALPDNLTTWQAEARGVTEDTKVGQATAEVVTTKDLLVRPVTPRFLVAGDHLALAAVVHNNTEEEKDVEVQLTGTGVQLDDPGMAAQTVRIPAGGRRRVEWWVEVEDTEQVDVLFSAKSSDLQDAVKPYLGPLPVLRYTAPQTYGTSGLLEESGQQLEIVSLPQSFDPAEGQLQVTLSPSLAAAVLNSLDVLEEDELFSTVDSLSFFLPQVISYQSLAELELEYPELETRLEEVITSTLDELAAAQNEDGGWGWSADNASDVEITSYLLFGLHQAERAGVFVPDRVLQRAQGYLLAALPTLDMIGEPWQYDQLAFQYFALVESGLKDLQGMDDLMAQRSQLSPYGQAFLALALESQQPGSELAQTLLSDLQSRAVRSASGAHWENPEDCRCWLNSSTTTSAVVTYALSRTDQGADLIADAVRYLVNVRRPRGDWWSYYETAWSVLALNEVLQQSGDLEGEFNFTAGINGTEVIRGEAAGDTTLEAAAADIPIADLYADNPNALLIERTEGAGSLYYTAYLTVSRPAEETAAYGREMSLSRSFAVLDEEQSLVFVNQGEVGQLIQVQLTLTLEHDSAYLAVEDTFPAGAEILDTRLKTTAQQTPDFQPTAPFSEGWGWWYFNAPQVFDDHIRWSAERLPAGTYQLSYTISLTHPGEFQVLPARAWQVFFPDIQAVSAGEAFEISREK